jgi:hypothetical protein
MPFRKLKPRNHSEPPVAVSAFRNHRNWAGRSNSTKELKYRPTRLRKRLVPFSCPSGCPELGCIRFRSSISLLTLLPFEAILYPSFGERKGEAVPASRPRGLLLADFPKSGSVCVTGSSPSRAAFHSDVLCLGPISSRNTLRL